MNTTERGRQLQFAVPGHINTLERGRQLQSAVPGHINTLERGRQLQSAVPGHISTLGRQKKTTVICRSWSHKHSRKRPQLWHQYNKCIHGPEPPHAFLRRETGMPTILRKVSPCNPSCSFAFFFCTITLPVQKSTKMCILNML